MPCTNISRNAYFFEIVAEQDIALDFKVTLLEDRNVNVTSQFVRIFKVFEDVVFTQNLEREMVQLRVNLSF